MIFRQLHEHESSTYTYLFGCPETRQAVLLDPVMETVDRDLAVLQALDMRLACTLETHIHADHITSACRLRSLTGCRVAGPALDDLPCADVGVSEDRPLTVGHLTLKPLFTAGHTDTHHSYLLELPGVLRVFTGDALLIDGCGRTDFQSGDAATLYRSVHEKLFTLPGDTVSSTGASPLFHWRRHYWRRIWNARCVTLGGSQGRDHAHLRQRSLCRRRVHALSRRRCAPPLVVCLRAALGSQRAAADESGAS